MKVSVVKEYGAREEEGRKNGEKKYKIKGWRVAGQ